MGIVLAYKKSTSQPAFGGTPAISGTLLVGETLTVSDGSPLRANAVSYQWRSWATDDRSGSPTLLGTLSTQVLSGNEAERFIDCVVILQNNVASVETTTAVSARVGQSTPDAPVFNTPASITGTLEHGATLTAAYDVTGASSVTFEWRSYADGITGVGTVIGASNTVVLLQENITQHIGLDVYATNAGGLTTKSSAPRVGPIAEASSSAPVFTSSATIGLWDAGTDFLRPSGTVITEGEYLVCRFTVTGATSTPTVAWYHNATQSNSGGTLLTGQGTACIKPLPVSEPDTYQAALFLDESLSLAAKYIYAVATAVNSVDPQTSTSLAEGPVGAIPGTWIELNQTTVGNGPYYLTQSNKTYYLSENITTPGTALAVTGGNVVVNLNGKTITFDNKTPVTVANGSFETGTGAAATGWDFTGAAAIERYAGAYFANQVFDGDYSLKIAAPCADQYVTNTTQVTLSAGETYSLSAMFFKGGSATDGFSLYVDLIGQSGAPNRRLAYSSGNSRGIQFAETYFTVGGTDETYEVRVGITGAAAISRTCYVDDVKIQHRRNYGVAVSAFSWRPTDYPWATVFGQADNCTVKNGTIIQGQDQSTWSACIGGYRTSGLIVSRVTTEIYGANSNNIWAGSGGSRYLDCHHTSQITTIQSRDSFHGSMLDNVAGLISRNVLLDGPHAGILANVGYFVARGNQCSMKNRYTNGFAITCYGNTLTTGTPPAIHDNVVNNTGVYSGRGIFVGVNSATADANYRCRVYNNQVQVTALQTVQEYGGVMLGGAYGIQLDSAANVEVFGNTVTAIALYERGAAAYRENYTAGSYVHDNAFIALRSGTPAAGANGGQLIYAGCIKMQRDSSSSPTTTVFEDNALTSNSLWLADCTKLGGATLTRCSFTISGDTTGARWFQITADSQQDALAVKNVVFVDPIYASSTERATVEDGKWWRGGRNDADIYSDYSVAWTTTIQANDTGTPQPGAAIGVVNSSAASVFSGTSDANGQGVAVVKERKNVSTGSVTYNDHTASASYLALTGQTAFTADQQKTVVVEMT